MPSSDMSNDKQKSRDVVLTENTDDFIIGDRVWVNGTKPGYIQYLGETRFSPGDWAGVVLDDHSGKNDGAVAGVKYFQCEPKRGVFARLHKLTRYPLLGAKTPSPTPSPSCLTPPPRSATPTRAASPGGLRLREGERVVVSSGGGPLKAGTLRFVGVTDFAAGEWAGVELDDPLGKNDGTVAGKRYFRCPPNYGLFSPLHKVSRGSGSYGRHSHDSLHSERDSDRDSQKDEPKAVAHLQKVERELSLVQEEHRKYVEDSERRANRLRQLLEQAETERKSMAAELDQERRKVEELEFRVDEECITKDDLQNETMNERRRLEEMQRRLDEEVRQNRRVAEGGSRESVLEEELKRQREESEVLRERLKQEELKVKNLQTAPKQQLRGIKSPLEEQLRRKDESLLQTQLSLDNKKREVESLHVRISEMEKDLVKCKSRQERHLETIDDLNVKLQKSESHVSTMEEEMHLAKENAAELERRLEATVERAEQLEKERARLVEQAQRILAPEAPGKEAALIENLTFQMKDIEKLYEETRRDLESSRKETARLREERERSREDSERKSQATEQERREELKKEKTKFSEREAELRARSRDLERRLAEERESAALLRAEAEARDARLARQEEQLTKMSTAVIEASSLKDREDQLKTEARRDRQRLKDQVDAVQVEKDLVQVEREEALRRLHASEEGRLRAEAEAQRASQEVEALRAQVHRLGAEFSLHRQDLVKKLAETQFDAQQVEDLQAQIEMQRRLVQDVQERLRRSEGQRNELQDVLTSTQLNKGELESSAATLRREVDALQKRLSDNEFQRQILQKSLEQSERRMNTQHHELTNALSLKDERDEEKTQLENKIIRLQAEVNALKRPDPDAQHTKVEREALEHQVDFLNSVIVDMQRKNDDLKSRMDILETEVLFDGHLNLGATPRHATARLFCDICEAFDLHDTEDCPKQTAPTRRRLSFSSMESEF